MIVRKLYRKGQVPPADRWVERCDENDVPDFEDYYTPRKYECGKTVYIPKNKESSYAIYTTCPNCGASFHLTFHELLFYAFHQDMERPHCGGAVL